MLKRTKSYLSAAGLAACCALILIGALPAYAQDNKTVPMQTEKPISAEEGGRSFWDFLTRKDFGTAVPVPPRKPLKAASANSASSAMSMTLPESDTIATRDAKIYQDIFALIRKGEITEAKNWMMDLKNGLLVGHAQAQILLHPLHKARFEDLQNWLKKYGDHPQAHKIYKLALARAPQGESVSEPKASASAFPFGTLGQTSAGKIYKSKRKRTAQQEAQVKNLQIKVRTLIRKTQPTQAYNLIKQSRVKDYLDRSEYDALLAQVASGYFYAGYNVQAKKFAALAMKKSVKTVPQAGWIYGLANWREDNYEDAAEGFEKAATSSYASGWMISAASYWAGRAHMRLSNHKKVSKWLELSASYPRTFYGLVATRALGRDPVFDWEIPEYTKAHRKYINASRHGVRAAALIHIGEIRLAEQEIKLLTPAKQSEKDALVAFANHYNLPSLSYRLGNAVTDRDGRIYDAALYPLMPWEPEAGYKIDSALLHAFARQESKFNSAAESTSGAAGLMQLMPRTAQHLSGGQKFDTKAAQVVLKNPKENLEFGQIYLKELLDHPAVDGDLMSLAIAYNAGPGNLSRWRNERRRIDEPLLFIETIPFSETRAFVERVLANFWIYRVRMGQENPTLEAVASGRWAKFALHEREELSKLAHASSDE